MSEPPRSSRCLHVEFRQRGTRWARRLLRDGHSGGVPTKLVNGLADEHGMVGRELRRRSSSLAPLHLLLLQETGVLLLQETGAPLFVKITTNHNLVGSAGPAVPGLSHGLMAGTARKIKCLMTMTFHPITLPPPHAGEGEGSAIDRNFAPAARQRESLRSHYTQRRQVASNTRSQFLKQSFSINASPKPRARIASTKACSPAAVPI
jgi:hypothetical protein